MSTDSPVLHSDDGTMRNDNPINRYLELHREAMGRAGRPHSLGVNMQRYLQCAGFEDIRVFGFKQPIGTWPKDGRFKRLGNIVTAWPLSIFDNVLMLCPEHL